MKKILRKIGLALTGMAMAAGLAIVTTVPAEAVTMSRVQHCNWPQKATVQVNGNSTSWRLDAYSPSGWKLGSYYGNGFGVWHTPWEDVSVWGYSSDGSWWISGHCRY